MTLGGCGSNATDAHLSTIPARDLRNHTSSVLRQVSEGEPVMISLNGLPVAELNSIPSTRRLSLSRAEFLAQLVGRQADAVLRGDLRDLGDVTTDDLGPIR